MHSRLSKLVRKSVVLSMILFSMTTWGRPLPKNKSWFSETISAPSALTLDFNFSGIVALQGCSGAIVRFTANDNANALVLTNGHCVGMLDDGPTAVYLHKPYATTARAFKNLQSSVTARTTEILYGMMAPHDLALLRLNVTYKQLSAMESNRLA